MVASSSGVLGLDDLRGGLGEREERRGDARDGDGRSDDGVQVQECQHREAERVGATG